MSTNASYNHVRAIAQMQITRECDLIKSVCHYLGCPDKADEVTSHFVYKDLVKKCLKAKKDVNAPKKAANSYQLFCNKHREAVAKKHPEEKMGGISKLLGKMWADTKEEVKQEFAKLAEVEKEKYAQAKADYDKQLSEQDGSCSGVGSSNSA